MRIKALLFVFLFIPALAIGNEDAARKIEYGDFLFKSGNYYEALWAYHEGIFLNPDMDEQIKQAVLLKMGLCYLHGEKYNEALQSFNGFHKKYPKTGMTPYALYYKGKTYEKAGRRGKSLEVYDSFLSRFPSHPFAFNAMLSQTVLWLKGENYEKASERLRILFPGDGEMQGIAEKIKDYHKPYSPALAGIYSALVPGLGQVYLGRYSEALSAFSLTGVFAGLSIYNVYLEKNYKPRADRNYWAASFFGALAGIFYFSNIYNAVNMAQQMNRFYQHQMMDRYSKKIYRYQLEIPVLTF